MRNRVYDHETPRERHNAAAREYNKKIVQINLRYNLEHRGDVRARWHEAAAADGMDLNSWVYQIVENHING